jgi:two-component system, NarL family, sensor histidine kinase DesK
MSSTGADEPTTDELERGISGSLRRRRLIIRTLVTVAMVVPVVSQFTTKGLTAETAFLAAGTVVFVVLVDRWVLISVPHPGQSSPRDLVMLSVIVVLGCALFVFGQMNWLVALAVAAAATGRSAASERRAGIGFVVCSAVGLGVTVWHHLGYGATLAALIVPLLAGLLTYGAERRNMLMYKLQQTRAELARMAVAEERLRISRDLHDLLGHSLSLIALKSEVAGRMIESDPERAAQEIAELETVARHSLAEVRQAVTGYRQPSLAAELAAARRMLASAGIDVRVDAPDTYSLPPPVDALLAWTVREGSTNIVRHSGARHAGISIVVTGARADAEVSDDGAGPAAAAAMGEAAAPAAAGTEPAGPTGSGLTGLAERASRLGGTLQAGPGERGGFRLRISVPIAAQSSDGPDRPAPHLDQAAQNLHQPARDVDRPARDQAAQDVDQAAQDQLGQDHSRQAQTPAAHAGPDQAGPDHAGRDQARPAPAAPAEQDRVTR